MHECHCALCLRALEPWERGGPAISRVKRTPTAAVLNLRAVVTFPAGDAGLPMLCDDCRNLIDPPRRRSGRNLQGVTTKPQKRIDAITGMLQACHDSMSAIASEFDDLGYEAERRGYAASSEEWHRRERLLMKRAEDIRSVIDDLETEKWQ